MTGRIPGYQSGELQDVLEARRLTGPSRYPEIRYDGSIRRRPFAEPVRRHCNDAAGQHKGEATPSTMRACNERNAKGKLCAGHLKRWYKLSEAAKQQFGSEAELYRCER